MVINNGESETATTSPTAPAAPRSTRTRLLHLAPATASSPAATTHLVGLHGHGHGPPAPQHWWVVGSARDSPPPPYAPNTSPSRFIQPPSLPFPVRSRQPPHPTPLPLLAVVAAAHPGLDWPSPVAGGRCGRIVSLTARRPPARLHAAAMDDGDLDFSNPDTYLCPALGTDPPSSCSMDSYFDEILKDTEHHACTHTHTCNPPVHDLSHTHTCVHVHTKIVAASPGDDAAESPSENNNTSNNSNSAASKKRPSGNRAAVRKYREKKKAHTASLEEEVVHLRALNQQLMKKLQSHAALEAEVARLRCLLVDIRGRIEGEIGAFPYQRPPPVKSVDLVSSVDQGSFLGGGAAAQVANSCDFRCNDQMYCSPGMQGAISGQVLGQGPCDVASIQCIGSTKSGSTKLPVCGGMDTVPAVCLPNAENK